MLSRNKFYLISALLFYMFRLCSSLRLVDILRVPFNLQMLSIKMHYNTLNKCTVTYIIASQQYTNKIQFNLVHLQHQAVCRPIRYFQLVFTETLNRETQRSYCPAGECWFVWIKFKNLAQQRRMRTQESKCNLD